MNRVDDYQGLGRHYETPIGWRPSVSTVLRDTQDRARLDAWVERVGKDYADEVRQAAADRGTALHSEIDDAMLFGEFPGRPSAWLESLRPEIEMALKTTNRISEAAVWSKKHNYAGTLDFLGELDGRTILWEWKTYLPSSAVARAKPMKKKREHYYDHMLQARAYAKAAGSSLFRQVDEIRVAIARCALRDGRLYPLPCQSIRVVREAPAYDELWNSFALRLGLWEVRRATMVGT